MSEILVAVDGPAGSGKSSVSKQAAKDLDFGYLDTGASYRALTLFAIRSGWQLEEVGEQNLAEEFEYQISTDPSNYWVKVNGEDVTNEIRLSEVELNVSKVASQPKVRSFMREQTRRLASECQKSGIIVEGRDITTVVLPDAATRVLLTASEEVRLARRTVDLAGSEAVGARLSERDKKDSKVVDFLTPAEGVSLLDTTELSFDQSV
ncbi:MAG: (d)CMP kinase, partial [Actinomycetota bacterium]